jgi:hypothetical protein
MVGDGEGVLGFGGELLRTSSGASTFRHGKLAGGSNGTTAASTGHEKANQSVCKEYEFNENKEEQRGRGTVELGDVHFIVPWRFSTASRGGRERETEMETGSLR